MGKSYSVCNETGYTWHYNRRAAPEWRGPIRTLLSIFFPKMEFCPLSPGATNTFPPGYPIFLKFENRSSADLICDYGGYKYTIIENRSTCEFQLLCGTKGHRHVCPHFGEQEKALRQQQRREEERREQQRREEERREQQRREEERREQQRQEKRREQQRREKEQREQQRREEERREQQQREEERREQQRREEERREQQRREEERREQQRREEERREQLRREEERREQLRREQERREQLRQEEERREQQRREEQRREQLRRRQERREQLRREDKRREQLRQEEAQRQQLRQDEERREKLREKQEQREQQRREQQEAYPGHGGGDTTAEPVEELSVVKQRFHELLTGYGISEDEAMKSKELEERMTSLQNEMMIQYFGGFSSLLAIEQAVGRDYLSLTDRLHMLVAMMQLVDSGSDCDDYKSFSVSKEHGFLLSLLRHLHKENRELAARVLFSFTQTVSALSSASRLILGHILSNDVWTPAEILLFLQRAVKISSRKIESLLNSVLTYRLNCSCVLSALHSKDPEERLHQQVAREADKDLDTLISEMREANYPESVLTIIDEVLRCVEAELSKLSGRTTRRDIFQGKTRISSLNLEDPDCVHLQQVLILMCKAVKECTAVTGGKGYFPRLTQLASLLVLLLPQAGREKGRLLEIATGEGKTCIVAMFAAIQGIRGVKPDIVTSSPVLATRDQMKWNILYHKFGLTSSVVPPQEVSTENYEELVKHAYRKDIVYGTVGTFAADTLRQEFEGNATRETRGFDMVIVDEVDYMTLDNGVQTTYLSHHHSSLRHTEQVLAGIWSMLSACRPVEMLESGEIHWLSRPQLFHKTAQSALGLPAEGILGLGVNLAFYSQKELDECLQAESEEAVDDANQDMRKANSKALEKIMARIGPAEQQRLLAEVEKKLGADYSIEYYTVVDNKASLFGENLCSNVSEKKVQLLLIEKGFSCQIIPENTLISCTVDNVKSKIKYSRECDPKRVQDYKECIVVPSFLKEYTEQLLPVFVENALRAVLMVEGREYLIEKAPEAEMRAERNSQSHLYDAIIPVDFMSTGVLQKNSKWSDGLQQFLEMKHQLAISPMTSVTNYMSNIHFFQRYINSKGIFGVTGTLGGDAEKDFLLQHYKTSSCVIPTHRWKKVVELPTVQVQGGKAKWLQEVCETAWEVAKKGQVVLIICGDVKTANEVHTHVSKPPTAAYPITMYTVSGRDEIENRTFRGGNIIVATNLAGRGTDIQVAKEVNACGGLFVLLTHFPTSQRVEKQVFGRTARKGNTGMVQMIVNKEQLDYAYQGRSVGFMRQLREQRELNHIQLMEAEFSVIDVKEKLFSAFCEFLDKFRQKFSAAEKTNCDGMMIRDIPQCFKNYRSIFDYYPAVNSLKESWAFWLMQNDERIREHKTQTQFQGLVKDLREELEQRSRSLLRGQSKNLHDHIKQAAGRTDLHRWNKSEGYGAKDYWHRAAECDRFYAAVALYNTAFVTINLGKRNYMSEAKELLQEAQNLADVFLSETANTMMLCYLSVTSDFRCHHENRNFLMQMQVRMNIFKSWKDYMKNALDKIEALQKSKDDAITECSSVYCLLAEKDFITANELRMMYQYGLGIVFEVKKKPRFSIDALICFLIGVLQVVAGVVVCVISCGAASTIGMGLINEGVSDIISGSIGMITGSFSWAEWAISKSIRIGVSLLCAGFTFVRNVGLKSPRALLQAGSKTLFVKSAASITLKQCTKHAVKYTVQELAKQGVLSALNYITDKGFKAAFENIFRSEFEKTVSSLIKENRKVDAAVTQIICQEVPKSAINSETDDFEMNIESEKRLRELLKYVTAKVIPDLITDLTKVHKVLSILSQVSNAALSAVENQTASGVVFTISKVLETAEYTTKVIEMLKAVPTEGIINEQFVPQFLTEMEHLQKKVDVDDKRRDFKDVIRLKEDFVGEIAKNVSEAFVNAFVAHLTSITSRLTSSMVNNRIGRCVENVLGRHESVAFFDNQRINHKLRMAVTDKACTLTPSERRLVSSYIDRLSRADVPASGIDIHLLTKSKFLNGKGIRIIVTDDKGKTVNVEHYEGTQKSRGHITLRLVKRKDTSKQKEGVLASMGRRVRGELQHYTGHFEVRNPDGTFSRVDSQGQNCFYQAVVQATTYGQRDVRSLREDAANLRRDLYNTVQQDSRYVPLLMLHRRYEDTFKRPGLFTISGGKKITREADMRKYKDVLNQASRSEKDEWEIFHLGMVAEQRDLIAARLCSKNEVNADHIPPKACYIKAMKILSKDTDASRLLQRNNPKAFEEIKKIESHNRGDTLLCMEVRTEHHRQALTTGRSNESRICRDMLAESFISGDMEKTLKLAFISSHPEASNLVRQDAGVKSNISVSSHSPKYYQLGFDLMIDKHFSKGLIDHNTQNSLHSWVNEAFGSRTNVEMIRNTPEYKDLKNTISDEKVQDVGRSHRR